MDNLLRSWVRSQDNWANRNQMPTAFDDAKTVLSVMPLATSIPFWDQNRQEFTTLHRLQGSTYLKQTAGSQT